MNIAFGILMTPDGTDYPWYTGCWGLHARWPDEGFCNLRRTWELLVESGARSWSKQDTISIPAGKIKSHLIFHISVLDFFQFYHMVHVFINMSLESIKMCFFFPARDGKQQQNADKQAVAAHPLLTDWNILKADSC